MAVLEKLDLPALAGALGQRLRAVGVLVTPEQSALFVRALPLVAPMTRRRLYWAARAVFVSSEAHLAAFDQVFAEVFAPRLEDDAERGDPHSPPLASASSEREPPPGGRSVPGEQDSAEPGTMSPSSSESGDDDDEDSREIESPLSMASEEERLGEKTFETVEPDELRQLRRLMERLEVATPQKRSRRMRRGRRGEQLDLRRTVRGSLHTGGDPIRLAHRRRRTRPRQLVMLCDISGSMETYARTYLQLLQGAASGDMHAEAFVFATRLTRVTRALWGRNPDAAIQRATTAAPDWSSGTRIGEALKTFNDEYGRRGMARGAVIVILSDGWERADPELVGREMERLARLAYRIVWVNPRASATDFSPGTGGMAAALPHCDALVSGHSLKALEEVAEAIGATPETEQTSWEPPSPETDGDEESWSSAERTEVQKPVPMPSGYSPKRGHTTA